MTTIHPDLYPYQKEGAVWLSKMRNAILADGMRVGKSGQSIAGADLIGAKNILVICPGIARPNWEREFHRWQTTPRTTGCVMSSKDRTDAEVVIVSYEMTCIREVLERLVVRWWDLIIVDEMHNIKSKSALRCQVVYGSNCDATKGLASRTKRVWLLSGTPMPNGPHELWVHARALFPSAVKGLESYTAWTNHFCATEDSAFGVKIVTAKNIDDFVDRMAPFIKQRLLQDVQPDLPPIRLSNVIVQPASVPPRMEHIEEQERVLRAALARAGGVADDGAIRSIETMHISSLHKWTGIAKAPAAAEYIANDMKNGVKKAVIFARHTEVFEVLKKTLPGNGAAINGQTPTNKRQPILDEFQGRVAGRNLDWLVVHIDIASTAIDLTAAHDVYFVETTWVPKDVQQAAMRCMGVNQKHPVLATILSLKGSIDEAINDTIVKKHQSISKIETRFAK